jgi:small subunit ribosomal protein S16
MLKIRMQRTGRTNVPSYRIVVIEHTASPKAGSFVERVGSYNPKSKERVLSEERIKHWLSVGAQPSGTVHNMLVSAGILSGKKVNVLPRKSPPKKEGEETASAEAPAQEAPAVPTE